MQRLNRYYKRSRIAEWKFRLLLRYFALDLTANAAAQLTEISERIVIVIFGKIRRRISEECECQSPFNNGEVEVDESYFGSHRVRSKRGRGAMGKTIVYCVYSEIITGCKKASTRL